MTEIIERVKIKIDGKKTGPGTTPVPPPRVRAAIAMIVTRFPRIDETFILREINELERAGQPVLVVPLLRGESKVVHEEAKPWVRRALYISLLSPAILLSNLLMFFRKPGAYLRLLMTLIRETVLRPSTLIRTLALFPKSVHLARILPQRGIRHVHSHFATHATTMAYIIASLSDITYSFTVHGPDVFVHRMLLAEKIQKAKFIRSISTFNKAFLCGLYPVLTDGKIEVVHTGVNPDVYARAAEEANAAAAEQPDRKPQILSVAALTPSRGFPFLVDACARLLKGGIEAECKIVGAGKLRALTEAWIAEHGMSDRVKLLGLQPQHEVARLMGECDIFVLPSIIALDGQMDGIPICLMEAMAAGKPVIASGISGIPELVKHNVNGIVVDAAHPERVAQAIRQLIADPQLRERLGRAGQLKVRNEFDVSKAAERLIALFDRHTDMSAEHATTAERIAGLTWSRLQTVALGVRRVHERGDSYVAEVTITDGIHKRDVIVRQHRDVDDESSPFDRARHEFEVLSTLRQSMSEEIGDITGAVAFTVPRVVMFDEPHAAVVVDRADGMSLAGVLRRRARTNRIAGPLRKAGAWLHAMQQQTRTKDDGRYVLTATVLLAMRDLDLAAAGDRALRGIYGRVIETLQSLEAKLSERPLSPVGQHGDYRPEHIFIGERRVDVIDFGSYREGLPEEDVAQMLVHLGLRYQGSKLEKASRAFLEGYDGANDPDALRLFTITKALALLARGTQGDGFAASRQRRLLRKMITRSLG